MDLNRKYIILLLLILIIPAVVADTPVYTNVVPGGTCGITCVGNMTANMTMNQTIIDVSWNTSYLLRSGVLPMTGNLSVGGFNISNLLDPVADQDAVSLYYLLNTFPIINSSYLTSWDDSWNTSYLLLSGASAMTGNLSMGGYNISGVLNPVADQDAVTLNYYNANIINSSYLTSAINDSYLLRSGVLPMTGDFNMSSFNISQILYTDQLEAAIPGTPPTNTLRLYVEPIHGFSFYSFKDDTGMVRKLVRDSVIIGYNDGAIAIPAFRAVFANGSMVDVPIVERARADSASTMPAIGITIESIPAGSYGRIMQVGLLENIGVDDFQPGDVIYVSPTVAGSWINITPTYPNIRQELGTVLTNVAGTGSFQVIARSALNDSVINHSALLNLDYATSGHTGFASTASLNNYYLNDTSKSLFGNSLRRSVNNDYLDITGGTGSTNYSGRLTLYGGDNVAQSGGFIASVGNASGSSSSVVFSALGRTDTPTLSLNNNKISNVDTGITGGNAANKTYVDSAISGGGAINNSYVTITNGSYVQVTNGSYVQLYNTSFSNLTPNTLWTVWTPVLTWATATPGGVTTAARWSRIGPTVFFRASIQSPDSNATSGLTISLPVAFSGTGAQPLTGVEYYGVAYGSIKDPLARISSATPTVISFSAFGTGTDNQPIQIDTAGFYEV